MREIDNINQEINDVEKLKYLRTKFFNIWKVNNVKVI
jgi:hypothetical protein